MDFLRNEFKKLDGTTATSSIVVLLAFSVSGWVLGWYTGASQSPVVATLLPLLFGLLGALSYGFLDRKSKVIQQNEALSKLGLDEGTRKKVEERLQIHYPARWMAAFWSLGVILFAAFCYFGTKAGIEKRVPTYPTLDKMLKAADVKTSELTPRDWAVLHRLRWQMKQLNIAPDDAKAAFGTVMKPAIEEKGFLVDWLTNGDARDVRQSRHALIESAADHLVYRLAAQKGFTPMSVPTPCSTCPTEAPGEPPQAFRGAPAPAKAAPQ